MYIGKISVNCVRAKMKNCLFSFSLANLVLFFSGLNSAVNIFFFFLKSVLIKFCFSFGIRWEKMDTTCVTVKTGKALIS